MEPAGRAGRETAVSPTEVLRREHRYILRMLGCAERAASLLRAGESVAVRDLRDLGRFFAEYADACHHAKEETHLFPALEAHGVPREGGPIAVMLDEHVEGRSAVRGMREAVASEQPSPEQLRSFAGHALHFVSLLRDHIGKEDHVLFRMAEDVLPREVLDRLGDTFDKVDALEIGQEARDELEATAVRLGELFGVPEQTNEANLPSCGGH